MPEVDVVRLVLVRHQHQRQSVDELHAVQGVDTHVHQDTVKNRHGNILQYWCKFHGETSEQEYANTGHTLLPENGKIFWLFLI